MTSLMPSRRAAQFTQPSVITAMTEHAVGPANVPAPETVVSRIAVMVCPSIHPAAGKRLSRTFACFRQFAERDVALGTGRQRSHERRGFVGSIITVPPVHQPRRRRAALAIGPSGPMKPRQGSVPDEGCGS